VSCWLFPAALTPIFVKFNRVLCSIIVFHLGFFGIKNAELFFIFIRNCRTMKNATGTVIIFFVLTKCRANFTDSILVTKNAPDVLQL